jgi:arylsulfatase A-like enzyme
MFTLDKLTDIPEAIPGPKFVYAQIIFPHPPFIVDAEGSELQNSPPDELSAYNDQITYLNTTLLKIIDTLFSDSETEPIIILQSDHGATIDYQVHGIDKSNRLGILNSYYLPDSSMRSNSNQGNISEEDQRLRLYSSISPVNTFRLIFDQYFGGDYGLLDDQSIVGRQSPFTTIECAPPG